MSPVLSPSGAERRALNEVLLMGCVCVCVCVCVCMCNLYHILVFWSRAIGPSSRAKEVGQPLSALS